MYIHMFICLLCFGYVKNSMVFEGRYVNWAVSVSTVAQLVRSLARMHKLIFNFGILRTCCMLGLACSRLNQNCYMVGTPPYYQV